MRVSHLAMHLEEHLAELDINPLMVLPSGQGVKAVDALDGSVTAVRHDDVAGDVSFGTPPGTQSAPTNDSLPRIPSDAVPGSMTALGHQEQFPPPRLSGGCGLPNRSAVADN